MHKDRGRESNPEPSCCKATALPTAPLCSPSGISTCCLKFTGTKIRRELLLSYYQEDKSYCRLQAVVFTTVNGKRICANPLSAIKIVTLQSKTWALTPAPTMRCLFRPAQHLQTCSSSN
uniref:C-C motif chemokine n=1 Tax=Poecilia reticulata TaxID=8081 RepID=A0A3P9Q0U9_POERE